jgi:hypothetical protein
MATIKENGQSYLEQEAIDLRHEQMGRSDYNPNNEYNEQHQDALSTGDDKGKGTGDFGGHGWIVPDMTKPSSQIGGMFNTDDGGNNCDHSARSIMTARSLYGPGREYGMDIVVDTSMNVAEGQYDGAAPIRVPYSCPVV